MALQSWRFDNTNQNEALINELKGSLFEFRFAYELAGYSQLNSQFLSKIAPELLERLNAYEMWLRNHDRSLLKSLGILAKELSEHYLKNTPKSALLDIELTGKSSDSEDFEGDVKVVRADGTHRVSLKLCKQNAFVNTKSGGILSFVEKYFGDSFRLASSLQKKLNEIVERSYFQLGQGLYAKLDLGDFSGQFDHRWPSEFLLPGALPSELKELMHQHYHRIITELHRALSVLFESDKVLFTKALLPIVGVANAEVVQLILFHGIDSEQKEKYQLNSIRMRDFQYFKGQLQSASFTEVSNGLSSFEIMMPDLVLQIRVKPMNKINAMALKVNCSIKERA